MKGSRQRYRSPNMFSLSRSLTVIAVAVLFSTEDAWTQANTRTGKDVVEQVCASCHSTGVDGAPKIGDESAWSKRTAAGLSVLTTHAIDGIRQMPAHGGNPDVTDFEIKSAVTYMVNKSGGSWAEPVDKSSLPDERSGEEIVEAHCAECHQTGKGGAPKIGDKLAWVQRLNQGLEQTVRSAINGHGGMPPRGGVANLTDSELTNAVLYMLNAVSGTEETEQP